MSKDWVSDIDNMHQKHGAKEVLFNGEFLRFRQRFLEEELREFEEAIEENNPQKAVDALIDLGVILIGTLDLGKVNAYEAWDEVLTANLAKEPGENTSRSGSGGFDLIKPKGWTAPTHENNIGNFGIAIKQIKDQKILKDPTLPSHVRIMDEWRNYALSKDRTYNTKDREFNHAEYYPDGIQNIIYEIFKKVKRFRSVLSRLFKSEQILKADMVGETFNDSLRDINIYSAIAESYKRKELEGQSKDRDIFNREIVK